MVWYGMVSYTLFKSNGHAGLNNIKKVSMKDVSFQIYDKIMGILNKKLQNNSTILGKLFKYA